MAVNEKWYFTKEQLANTPSRKCGIDADKELSYRQQAANFIQDMGMRLVVSQLCINTAIVYMHRFYVFHSLSQFHRNSIAAAALFLAAKVEEQPRKLEHVIKVAHLCLHRDMPALDIKSEQYLEQAQDLVFNENVLLQTLGFDVAIDHPHTHVVRCCHLVKASKDLAQTSYFMASNSLHLTTMCLQYKPTVVACFCIHLACKWSNWEIPQSNEGKYWFWYVDRSVTSELLGQLTGEFLHIFDKCPSRLKRKIRSISANQSPNITHPALSNSPFDAEPRRVQSPANADGINLNFQSNRSLHPEKTEVDGTKKSSTSMPGRTSVDYREYREKKERERLEREKASANTSSTQLNVSANESNKHHSHHHKQSSSGASATNKHSSSSSSSSIKQSAHHNHHSSRQDVKSSSQMMPQRHSTGSSSTSSSSTNQLRDPNRDRQRMSREHNTSSASASNAITHCSSLDNSMDNVLNSSSQDSSTAHPPEKLSNNVHKTSLHDSRSSDQRHSSSSSSSSSSSKPHAKYTDQASTTSRTSRKPDILEQRSEEVRKLIEKPLPLPKPRAEVLKEEYVAKMLKQSHHPSKYEHLPEKTPSVNSTQAAALPTSESKVLNIGQTAFSAEKSPSAPVSATQISQKSLSGSKTNSSSSSQQIAPMKNGSSSTSSFSLLNNLDDAKAEKRPRHLTDSENSTTQTPPPVTKHRSLFSPEKTPTPTSTKESSHSQRMKQKQKSSPAIIKQDALSSYTSPSSMQITSETTVQNTKQRQSHSSSSSSTMSSSSQKHRNTEAAYDQQQAIKQQQHQLDDHSRRYNVAGFNMQDQTSLNSTRTPELVQPTKESPMCNKNTVMPSSVTETKSHTDIVKSFDGTDTIALSTSNQRHKQQHHGLSNGLDTSIVKQEYSTIDPSSFIGKNELPDELLSNEMPTDLMFIKQEQEKLGDFLSFHDPPLKREVKEECDLNNIVKPESFSPLKSAQSISALLQEPLAPMPSLLQQVPNFEQHQQQPQQLQAVEEDKSSMQLQQQHIQEEPLLPSTVDMSDLVTPIQCTVDIPSTASPLSQTSSLSTVTTATPTTPIVPNAAPLGVTPGAVPSDAKKVEHRSKGDKKKEKKKHKHKDKDRTKDKHKHKHKDKDKEKDKHHREKSDREKDNKTEEGNSAAVVGGNAPSFGAAPIKITIPKDKLNLSTDSIGTSTPSGGSSLKIKIPKERLKGTEVSSHQLNAPTQQPAQQQQQSSQPSAPSPVQAPLKIKIRTDALNRSATSTSSVGSELQSSQQDAGNGGSRKRDRVDATDGLAAGAPPSKKQQQRPNERQNGRHSYGGGGGPGNSDKGDRMTYT